MFVTHFIWADYSSTAELSPPLLIGETCAFSRFPLKPDQDRNPLICQIVTQWRKSTPCLTHRPLLGKSLSSALSCKEWIILGICCLFSVFFFAFCSILLHFLANTSFSSRFKRCLPASCLSAFIGSALSASLWSQNHSASLCLSIGEGGLYSHPRYRRSFTATWQKTRNLFKSLQNRLSKT